MVKNRLFHSAGNIFSDAMQKSTKFQPVEIRISELSV